MAGWLVSGYSVRKDLGLGIMDVEYETDFENQNQNILHVGLVDFKKCACERMISLLE